MGEPREIEALSIFSTDYPGLNSAHEISNLGN
jgi:hypothetical protein